jgi:hypothetical protein
MAKGGEGDLLAAVADPPLAPLQLHAVETDPIVMLANEKAKELQDATVFGSVSVVTELCSSPRLQMYLDHGIGHARATALICAAEAGRLDTATVLMEAGADVGISDALGRTALMFAAGNGHKELVRTLIERGAHSGPRAQNGWTGLMFACAMGHHEAAAELLLACEARGEAVNEMVIQSALGLARKQEQEVVTGFLEALLEQESPDVAAALTRANALVPTVRKPRGGMAIADELPVALTPRR